MRTSLLIATVACLHSALLGADWTRVAELPANAVVRVETATGKQTGTLLSVSDEVLRFTTKEGTDVSVGRAEIRKVHVRTKSHRVRNAIIGTAVGVAVGAVIYGTLGALFRNEGRDDTALMLAVPIGIGSAVGAALPTGSMKKVYDAAK